MEAPDFIAKYGPLIHILEHGEEDLEAIAEEQGYTRVIGREWRDTHCKAVLGYLRAIRTDYEVLWQQTSAKALSDAWLGTWLGNVEKELRHLERQVRVNIFLQRLIPPPSRGNGRRRFRKLLLGLSPKVSKSDVEQILCTMRKIHKRGDATIYLP
jgi:hypothetical protein